MIETLKLDAANWNLLPKEMGERLPEPDKAIAFVSMDGGNAVGRIFLMAPFHIEGVWINAGHRNGLIFNQLMKACEKEAKSIGITSVFGYSISTEISGYLKRLGYEQMPWTVWRKQL